MVVGENNRTANIMDGIENTGDVRLHDHRLRLKQRFDIVRKLGQGTYGKVQLGINKKTGQEVAIKTIKKCKIETEADLVRIRREVQIMSSVRHPNIVHIYEVFENSEKMILVMEYCSGGELYDYLSKKKVLQEDEARRLFRQIATAVYYCHIHKICHRDLKLENVLLDDTGSAKIADFGLSNVFKETSLLSTFCGSPLYASPEIVKGTPYIGPEVDCWSLGVLLYTLVYGAMPFDGSNFKRLVRQISNGDYYEPKSPSSASPLIRDMLTVDPLKRADIAYICDNSWVNCGYDSSCLEVAEALAAETPVRLDLLLSLAPAAPANSHAVVVPPGSELCAEESGTDLTSSASMAVEPSNSAEKRILELVAEGGEDAIKPSPTRTIVSAGDNKRKLEAAISASGLHRKKERVASSASVGQLAAALPEDAAGEDAPADPETPPPDTIPPTLKSSATITIQPSAATVVVAAEVPPEPANECERCSNKTQHSVPEPPKEEPKEKVITPRPRVVIKKKPSPTKTVEEKASPEKQEEPKQEDTKPSPVSVAADKLTGLSLAQTTPSPAAPAAPASPATPATTPPATKPKKLSIPGGNVGSFKEQFERRASLTAAPDLKRNATKPVSKLARPKAASEEREVPKGEPATAAAGSVRLQQIGIEPSQTPPEEAPARGGVKKTESEPSHGTAADPAVLLEDARRSLQNSMAKLVEETFENRRRAARDIISTAIRTGKPPMPYGRSSSAGVASLASLGSPPPTPPAAPPTAPVGAGPKVFRTEAQHRVEDHRNRGVSVERIIPINLSPEEPRSPPAAPQSQPPPPQPQPQPQTRASHTPLRRLVSNESCASEAGSSAGEPIKKSAREFIIPIAVEGKGYVTPRQRSLEPDQPIAPTNTRLVRPIKPRRISNLVSGGESEEEDDMHMHRLRSSRAARAESVSSGEEDEEDEGFHLLTAENLFSTLLHRVRALTNRLNGEEGPGFSQHPHSLFNNLQSPFFQSPHLPRRNLLREGWGSRDLHADLDSMFGKTRATPRGNNKKSKHQTKSQQHQDEAATAEGTPDQPDLDLSSIQFSDAEMRALSGLTPALARRLRRQLLAHLPLLPPRAARDLRRTLSLHAPASAPDPAPAPAPPATAPATPADGPPAPPDAAEPPAPSTEPENRPGARFLASESSPKPDLAGPELPAPQYCTLPRPRRSPAPPRESPPPAAAAPAPAPPPPRPRSPSPPRAPSARTTPDRSLLSKYLTPERTVSLDDSYSSDGNSILSEPSYIAAYGAAGAGGAGFRRHSMRLAGDHPRKRISRFLRSDFYMSPPDESLYAKHKKEKELETQKILREIREKKNKTIDNSSPKSPTDATDVQQPFRDEAVYSRKCLSPISPIGILTGKERSRSNTPFFPILDNIKETTIDTSLNTSDYKRYDKSIDNNRKSQFDDILNRDSKLSRPRSYPIKNHDTLNESPEKTSESIISIECENKDKTLPRESKLIRPKSYPTSSPSPEKVFVNRNFKKEESPTTSPTENTKNDVEVTFSFTLPKKSLKPGGTETLNKNDTIDVHVSEDASKSTESNSLLVKKYQILNNNELDSSPTKEQKNENGNAVTNGNLLTKTIEKPVLSEDLKLSVTNHDSKKEEVKLKSAESEPTDKKGTIKKKIIRKVSSKSKTDVGNQDGTDAKSGTEKKKVTKKVKDKTNDDSAKTSTVTKKKSVLQTIGHKLEKFTSAKSSSPEKATETNTTVNNTKKENPKLSRTQREHSVPVTSEPPTESNLIKRAVTLTDVAALDTPNTTPSKTTVSKVLGLFKKFEPKEKNPKPPVEKSHSENLETHTEAINENEVNNLDNVDDKPKRPTSLLLNGIGRKKYGKTTSDSVTTLRDDKEEDKKESTAKNIRNTLKLDFSRLPRVKKIVPTNPVIEPQFMNITSNDKDVEKKESCKNGTVLDGHVDNSADNVDTLSRSRSRSRSSYSNSDIKSDNSADAKNVDRNPLPPPDSTTHHPHRNHESTTPEKEDIVDRIRRKSFYTRFNEKKLRRKSNLVGPGATEYDPIARIHAPPDTKFDISPTSPTTYDLSPGYSVASDLSPSTERYRTLLNDMPLNTRSSSKYDNYGLNDKIDMYRSLDRNDFRKYSGAKSYLDYDQPSSYTSHRYSRTKSLLDNSDGEDQSLGSLREPHKYNRTLSMYSPGSYATYRPKRTLNSAIILKESEKEPSPENILERIRQRKKLASGMTRKPESEKDPMASFRSDVPSKGESDSAECSEKVD